MVAGHLQIKNGYYYMVLNTKDANGKRKPLWIKTELAAGNPRNEKLAQDMLLETRYSWKESSVHGTGKRRLSGNMLFADYMNRWLDIVKNSVEETTYAGYQSNVKARIYPYFIETGVTLANLTALDIEDFYEYCFNDLGLKGTTVQKFHANIHRAMKYAAKHDLITKNPMDKVERPKKDKFEGQFLTIQEVEELFVVFRKDPLQFAVFMAAFYGLRRSEICGLKWSAIDFEANRITVNHRVVQYYVDGKYVTRGKDRTKSDASRRSLPLVPQFRELLIRMKLYQRDCERLCGNCYKKSEYIFVNEMGVPYSPNYVTQHFAWVIDKCNFRKVRFHDLRHTCASLLLKAGVSLKDIQEWLGHSSYSTTANIYAHLYVESKDIAAEKMSEIVLIDSKIPVAI